MFDPKKMDIDVHIDLIDTLGNMLGQKDESKKDKFIDTMPTIIQMHLITEEDWAVTTKKAKESEHIIRKCDPPAAALPTLAKGTAVPDLYSHIAHSNDKDEAEIAQSFKGAHPNQPKPRGKGKQLQQKLKNPPPQIQDDQYNMRVLTTITIMGIIGSIQRWQRSKKPEHISRPTSKMMTIKAIITRVIKDFIIIHVEISPKLQTI